MAKSESIFSIRGIVRGYRERHLPGEVPAQIFFLAMPGEPEIPITLENTRIAMRNGHDLEVFYLHHDHWDSDLPLMVNNYSTQRLETLAAPLLKKVEPEKPPLTKEKKLLIRVVCGVIFGFIAFIFAASFIGKLPGSLLVACITYALAVFIPFEELFAELNVTSRTPWDRRREMLEDYIKDKYGSLILAEEPSEKPN